jgi:hypothetical protein
MYQNIFMASRKIFIENLCHISIDTNKRSLKKNFFLSSEADVARYQGVFDT